MEAVAQLKLTLVLFFVAVCLVLVPSTHARDVKYCDKKGNYAVKVRDVEISPYPVVSGKAATFNISASTDQAIDGGKVVIEVSYFGLHVHTEKIELSDETSCPIAAGNFVLSHTQTLPGYTPPGSYTLKMTMENDNNQVLACISFSFKISFGSLVSAT
ncbi:uncharacterized protein LOC133877826 [Alnus glutinosa]|uniref:uncharacterized protein LOC133877826 n=1 Tax=Alnus glutinosa TaxID=3517 RepID=UPI002D779165|nr:uncharacterized protein LOC133877826 [Alnus glutinosa]